MYNLEMLIRKAYRLKLYPNTTQRERLWQITGACRFVWNHYLDRSRAEYLEEGTSFNYFDCTSDLTSWKKTEGLEWLEALPVHPLQQTLRDLTTAYKKFWTKQARFPRFKSRKNSHQSFRIPAGRKLRGTKLQIGRNTIFRFRGTTPPTEASLKSVTVSSDATGQWWASIITEQEIESTPKTGGVLGIDVGLNHLVVTSKGEKIENIRPRKQSQRRMKRLQQSMARKQKGSNARANAKARIARLHGKVANRRSNHLHHVSKRIASENQAVVACEDLTVRNMMKNHSLAGSIADASWRELTRQLEYKQVWSGGTFVKIDRFFPSSKTCSNCGFIISLLPLSIRSWTCPRCSSEHDRDVNAAVMIAKQAAGERLRVETTDGSHRLRSAVRVTGSAKH